MTRKIAFLIPSLGKGGAERIISHLSLNLSNRYEKYIILYSNNIEYPFEGNIINANLRNNIENVPFRNPIKKIYHFKRRINKLKKIKKRYNIQTTISFLVDPNILNIIAKSEDKIIISARNYRSPHAESLNQKIYNIFIKLFYKKADLIVAISYGVKNNLVDNFKISENKIKVIYNPCDIEYIYNLKDEKINSKYDEIFKHPVVINVGRLVDQKGQWHLIRAFNEVKKNIPNAKLVILGKGKLKSYLENLVNSLNMEQDIYILDFQSNPFKFLRHSNVFVLSSLYEGFGNVIIEAMACGVPVVSTDCKSGPREILSPNSNIEKKTSSIEYAPYGVLVPACDGNFYSAGEPLTYDEKKLADGITTLLNDTSLRNEYGILSEKRAYDFHINNIISEWEEILK